MKCNLERIVEQLAMQFSVQSDGELFRAVTDVQLLTADCVARAEVLYVTTLRELMQYDGPTVLGPVLCVDAGGRRSDFDRTRFSTVIWVNAPAVGPVYLALGKLLYEEGTQSSALAEAGERFLHCKSLRELVEVGYAYLGNPFAVFDENGSVIAYTEQAGERDANWQSDEFLRAAYSSGCWNLRNQAINDRARAASLPVRETAPDSQFPAMIRLPLDSRGQMLGVLIVTALFRPLTRRDEAIVQLLGQFMALDLVRQLSIRQSSTSDAGALRRYLETGEMESPGVGVWFHRQLEKAEPYQYILLLNGGKVPQGVFLDVERVMREIPQLLPGAVCTRLEAGIVLYFSVPDPIVRHAPVLEPLETYLRENLLVAGLSNSFSDVTVCRTALRQAAGAIRYGGVLEPERILWTFADVSLFQGLDLLREKMDLRELLYPGLCETLAGQDGDDLKTLEAYLRSGCRKSKTAELLYVHLNTVKYRLAQISQRLGADLDDPEVAFRLDLSLRVLKFLKMQGQMEE